MPSDTRISGGNVERTKQVSCEHYDILLRNKFHFLLTQFAFGIQSSETIFSLVSIRCLISALKFSLARMASESAKLTSQNGISTSLTSWLPLVISFQPITRKVVSNIVHVISPCFCYFVCSLRSITRQ